MIFDRAVLVPLLLAAAFLTTAQEGSYKRYLPSGSVLERPPAQVRLSPAGPQDVVLFYSSMNRTSHRYDSHVTVLAGTPARLKKIWTVDCNGAYKGFWPDTGVYDINHTGRPKIVVDCVGFTVCPNLFGIFEFQGGKISPVPADFRPLDTCQLRLKDLDKDGISEILIKFEHMNALTQIYHWNGRRYAWANTRYPGFYDTDIKGFESEMFSSRAPMASSLRLIACRLAVEAFKYQGRTQAAIDFLRHAVPVFEDPALTNPIPATLSPAERTKALAERKTEIASALAKIRSMIEELSRN